MTDRLEYTYYRVVITTLTGGAAPADGGIDNITPEQYGANADFPTTLDNSLAKERANMRYEEVIRQVSLMIQPILVSAFTSDAGGDQEASSFEFTLMFDRDYYVFTIDETSSPDVITGADAVKRCVERALIIDIVKNRQIYDPTHSGMAPPKNSVQVISVTAGAAEATLPISAVTVTLISDIIPSA